MTYIIIVLAILLGIIGIIGAIVPGLPGTPLSYLGILILIFLPNFPINLTYLIVMGVIAVIITILDYVIPIIGTKKFGGTKLGVRGSTIGLIISLFVLPVLGITIGPFGIFGIILGPFLGAYIGEMMAGNKDNAMKAAIGSFVGFLAGTLLKVVYGIIVLIFIIKDSWSFIF
jgi:uncharacterized protein YqgC (DUF456 family)